MTVLEAETYKFLAEARKFHAEAETAELKTAMTKMDMEKAVKTHEDWMQLQASRRFYFFQEVEPQSVGRCIDMLEAWNRIDPKCDIEIVFNSPGGDIVEGFALFDYLQGLRRQGHRITTVALGMAASMAGVLLQAGDVRVMSKESWLMLHEASFVARGKTSQVEDTTEWIKKVQDRILDIFAARSTLSKSQLKTRWSRKDWWLSSEEAMSIGLIDEVR
jgi:ATP-dependent Clp endopeptidase proteolytic subunit ClpP